MWTPPSTTESGSIRMFSDAALQAQLDKITSELPEGHSALAVDVGVDADGDIRAVGAVHLDGGWSVIGGLEKKFKGEWTGELSLRWSGR